MKAIFKQSFKNARFMAYCFLLLLIFIFGLISNFVWLFALILLPMALIFSVHYHITDDDLLKGNGTVPIKFIRKIVFQSDWVDLYFSYREGDKIRIKQFYPADKQGFADKLKEINPSIEII